MGGGGEGGEDPTPTKPRPELSRDPRLKWIKKRACAILKLAPEEWTNFVRESGSALQVHRYI